MFPGSPARIIPWSCSTRSAVSAAVARAMASQPPPPIGERAIPGGSSSVLTQTAAAPRATSPGNAGEWTQEPLRPSRDRWKSLARGLFPIKTTQKQALIHTKIEILGIPLQSIKKGGLVNNRPLFFSLIITKGDGKQLTAALKTISLRKRTNALRRQA